MTNHKNNILKSVSLAALAVTASSFTAPALAASANISAASANALNLLSPFLTLNATAAGQQTLQDNLAEAVAINQNTASAATVNGNLSTSALAALSISDENLLGSQSNTVYGIPASTTFGVAANLAGGLPTQNTTSFGTSVNGAQAVGGFGAILGAAYVADVGSAGSPVTLPKTVTLLTTALCFTGNTLCNGATTSSGDSQVAKFYFANGTWNGAAAAVAPTGSTLPTANGLPNLTNSVYDTAYGVTNSQSGQNAFGDSHPYQTYQHIAGASYTLYDPTVKTNNTISGAVNPGKPSSNPSFPSSHMAYSETDSILLGMMVPQLYQAMLLRASEMGESRIVVGVHYPTDIIASRAMVAFDLVNYLSNPSYINNAATTGTAVNLPSLVGAATSEIQSVLGAAAASASCGTSLATCATSSANANPYAPSTSNAAIYAARQTYGLPTLANVPAELTDTNGQDATILLASVYGGSSSAARSLMSQMGLTSGMYGNLSTATIQQIIANTESAAFSAFYGTQLSYWSRINLYGAIGYFSGVTGTLTLASADQLKTNVTVASGGALGGAGVITGNVTFQSGSSLTGASGATLTVHGGGVTLQNGSSVALSGTFLPGTYTLVTVDAGQTIARPSPVSVTGAILTYETASLVVTGDPALTVTLTSNLAGLAQTPNQRAVAAGIDAAANAAAFASNSPGQAFYTAFVNGGNGASAFDSLSGAGIAAANTAALLFGDDFADAIGDQAFFGLSGSRVDVDGVSHLLSYAENPRTGNPIVVKGPLATPERDWRLWGVMMGGGADYSASNAHGAPASTANTFGGLMGLDYLLQRNWLAGAAVGGGDSRFNTAALATSGHVSSVNFGLYTAYEFERGFYGELSQTFGFYTNHTHRVAAISGVAAETLGGGFSSFEERTRAEIGRKLAFGGFGITPFLAFEYANLNTGSFTETNALGAATLALTSKSLNIGSAPLFVGFRVGGQAAPFFNWTATPDASFAWVHEFLPDRKFAGSLAVLPGSDYTVYGPRAASDAAQVKVGLVVAVTDQVSLFAKFVGELAPSASSYGGRGGFSYQF